MPEDEKVTRLMKGVAKGANTFSEECHKLEEAQHARLAIYHRLSNIAQSTFIQSGNCGDDNFWSHVRESIREEVRHALLQTTTIPGALRHDSPFTGNAPHNNVRSDVSTYLPPPPLVPAGDLHSPETEAT